MDEKGRGIVEVTVQQLAKLIEGQVYGDGALSIKAATGLDDAGPGDITFVENDRHARHLKGCRAAAVVVTPGIQARLQALGITEPLTLIAVKDPLASFIVLVQHLKKQPESLPAGIDSHSCIHPTAKIGADCGIHPFVTIGEGSSVGARCQLHPGVVIGRNCRLGDDVILYPNVVLYDGTVLGNRVIVHANAVLGADGFGYRTQNGSHIKVPQMGSVEIGDDVEIGACTTIDRGTFQATRIGAGTKIDNLVMIGHNCHIGRHNLLVSQVGIAGSCTTGDYVVMAGQVGIADHVHIGEQAMIGAKAGVPSDLAGQQRYLGTPARPESEARRIMIGLERLPGLIRDVRQLKLQAGITEG